MVYNFENNSIHIIECILVFQVFESFSIGNFYRDTKSVPLKSFIFAEICNHCWLRSMTKETTSVALGTRTKPNVVFALDETLIYSTRLKTPASSFKIYVGRTPFFVHCRPGLKEFLHAISDYFNIYFFTVSPKVYADAVINEIAPFVPMECRYYDTSIRYIKGYAIKDLQCLNVPLDETILVDSSATSGVFDQDNMVITNTWFGDPNETTLTDVLEPLLMKLARQGTKVVSALRNEMIRNFSGITFWRKMLHNP